jgi:DNA (cytosine-5)-methyltransferase 1
MNHTVPALLTVPSNLGEVDWFDGFCGAGGSANGLEFIPGFKVTCAVNHWELAVQAHNANFPNADHDIHDIEHIHPRRFKRTRCAWFSPECTHHTRARGKQQTDDEAVRSRMTMMDVVRYSEYHRYDAVIVENVIEARLWCDIHDALPILILDRKSDDWLNMMGWLGYEHQIVFFNSQFALVPQSRDRMYVVFWRKGLRRPDLDFRPPSWCGHCESVVPGIQTWKKATKGSARDNPRLFEWGRYGSQYLYTCAACHNNVAPMVLGSKHVIDWSELGQRIGDRETDLAVKTRHRIKVGLERIAAMTPVTVQVGGHLFERPGYARVWSVDDPLKSVTATPYMSLVVPERDGCVGGSAAEPMGSLTQRSQMTLIARLGGAATTPKDAGEPLMTVQGNDRQIGMVEPDQTFLVRVNRGGEPERRPTMIGDPMPTIAGHGELALVSLRNNGDAQPGELPAHTLTAGGLHHGMLVYNGVPGFVRSAEDAAGTITSCDKQAVLVPYYNTGVAHPVGEPMGTVTSKDRQALVVTEDDIDNCTFRMLQWQELLQAQAMHVKADGTPYRLEAQKKGRGGRMRDMSNEERTKMIGNAVSSPVATMLGAAVAEILAEAA